MKKVIEIKDFEKSFPKKIMLKNSNWISWQNKLFNSMTLKTIALISMIIDHVGLMLYPEIIALRITGRIALPIYTFLIAFGFEKTKNDTLYFLKFFLMFICLQIPTTWFLFLQERPQISPFYMNIFANLTLGAGFIMIYKKNKILSMIYFAFILTFLVFIQKYNLAVATESAGQQRFTIDYGVFGFLLIPSFWMARKLIPLINKNYKNETILINLVSVLFFITILLLEYFLLWKIDLTREERNLMTKIQLWSLVTIPLILLFTSYQFNIQSTYVKNTLKYFFWLSYPVTIGITTLIASAV